MTQYKKDMISALVFLIIGIAVLISVPTTISDKQITGIGPRAFPNFVGVCMVALSLILGISTFVKQQKLVRAGKAEKPRQVPAQERKARLRNELRAVLAALICLVYAWAFDKVSYFVSTFVLITALLALFRVKKLLSYIVCYIGGVVIWACFTYFFSVRLP